MLETQGNHHLSWNLFAGWYQEPPLISSYPLPRLPYEQYSSPYATSIFLNAGTSSSQTQKISWSDTQTGNASIRASEGDKYILTTTLEAPNLDTTYTVSDDSDYVLTWMEGNKLYARLIIRIYYQDADEDGFGDAGAPLDACSCPFGYVEDSHDCDDGNPQVYPGARECADGIDNNCNGQVDEGCGDMNHDGKVNNDDYLILLSVYGSHLTECAFLPEADLDCDGSITVNDYRIFYTLFSP